MVEAKKRNLRCLRAEYHKRKGDLRDMYKKKMCLLRGVRDKIRKLEADLVENDGNVSEPFSSGSSVAPCSSSSSDSDNEADNASCKATIPTPKAAAEKKKVVGVDEAAPKGPASSNSTKPAAHLQSSGKILDTKTASDGTSKKRPRLSPGAEAPNHKGKPNLAGSLYPGFAKSDPKFCGACEQLRRGFVNATRAHRPVGGGVCEWAPKCRTRQA